MDDNFSDMAFIDSVKFPLIKIDSPCPVKAIDDSPLETGTHKTENIALTISGNHQVHFMVISFMVISSPASPVVLGIPWLKKHNLDIDWVNCSIVSWSTFCHSHSLHLAVLVSHSS